MPNIADILKGVGRVGLNQMLNQAPKPYPDIDPDTGAPTGSHTYKKGTFQPPDQISDFLSEWFGKYLGEEAPPEQVLEYTIHENGINSELNEEELERLTKLVGESYKKHDKLLSQAEFIDKIDGWDLSFVLDLLANPAVIAAAAVYAPPLVPILTTLGGAGLALETIESVPKMAYAIDAGVKLNDYAMMGKLLGLEFLSFLPLVGDLIDMAPLYKNHIDKSIRRYAAKEFEKGNASEIKTEFPYMHAVSPYAGVESPYAKAGQTYVMPRMMVEEKAETVFEPIPNTPYSDVKPINGKNTPYAAMPLAA